MNIKDRPSYELPCEKLITHGARSLSEAEIIAIIMGTGTPQRSVLEMSEYLLCRFAGIQQLCGASCQKLCEVPGVGKIKYARLQASLELGRRYLAYHCPEKKLLKHSRMSREYISAHFIGEDREIFVCFFLDTRNQLITSETLFHGTIDSAAVYPREVVRRCIEHNAAAVIFAHNHPSGHTEPSIADRKITRHLIEALAILDIRVLDHIIVGHDKVTSFVEEGLI